MEEWKATLRGEPTVARLVLRRLVEPLVVPDESERPEWILYGNLKRDETCRTDWVYVSSETAVKVDGLLAAAYVRLASPTRGIPEWTREVPGEVPATGGGKAASFTGERAPIIIT